MQRQTVQAPRDRVRARLVEVAAELLATLGPGAVTTRSVAAAAGVQAPVIYRLFGDKDGLLEAVAEHGMLTYLANKRPLDADGDPVDNLRASWYLHVGFGLANPALFRLMHAAEHSQDWQRIVESGSEVHLARVRRVARAGRLRVTERHAVELLHAAGTGVVFTLVDRPEGERDESLLDLAWESVCLAILVDPRTPTRSAASEAAIALRAALPDLASFTSAERVLLREWLDRVSRA